MVPPDPSRSMSPSPSMSPAMISMPSPSVLEMICCGPNGISAPETGLTRPSEADQAHEQRGRAHEQNPTTSLRIRHEPHPPWSSHHPGESTGGHPRAPSRPLRFSGPTGPSQCTRKETRGVGITAPPRRVNCDKARPISSRVRGILRKRRPAPHKRICFEAVPVPWKNLL